MAKNKQKMQKKRTKKKRTPLGHAMSIIGKIVGTVLLVCVLTGVIFTCIFATYLKNDVIPNADFDVEDFTLDQTSFIYYQDNDGNWQELQQLHAAQNRIWADYETVPENLVKAAVAIEDKRFYEHQGVDWLRTTKACLNMFVGNDSTYGGSTITQQLIKNLTQDDEVTVRRKILEIFRALEFEKQYTKETIMEWYLNTIYLGEGCYGVESASMVYFGKDVSELTLAECASLIGITNNPSIYDPYINEEKNRSRQHIILDAMLEQELITQEEYDEAVAQELIFVNASGEEKYTCRSCWYEGPAKKFSQKDGVFYCPSCYSPIDPVEKEEGSEYYSYFVDAVIRDVVADLMEATGYNEETCTHMVMSGGYHIYTTVDMDVQKIAEDVYSNAANVPNTTSSQQLQSAMTIVDNRTGDVVAIVGGVGEKGGSLTYCRATQATLSPGSAIKPLTVYGPALDLGLITPSSVYLDSPFKTINGVGWPKNQGGGYRGNVTISQAVNLSLNTVAVKVLDKVGLQTSFDYATQKFCLSTLVTEEELNGQVFSDIDYSPLALGSFTKGVTVREMTSAYASFVNKGIYREGRTYTQVTDSDGNIILDNTQESHQAVSEAAAFNMTYMLQNAVKSGTARPAALSSMQVAGKTGTTSDDNDRWFAGYTPYYTACVWCGFDAPEEIILSGSSTNPAIVMWRKVMSSLHEGLEYQEFFNSSLFTTVNICSESGLLATEACSSNIHGSTVTSSMVLKEDMPTQYCNVHVLVDVCEASGCIANEWCALVEGNSVRRAGMNRNNTAVCTIHTASSVAQNQEPLPGTDPDDPDNADNPANPDGPDNPGDINPDNPDAGSGNVIGGQPTPDNNDTEGDPTLRALEHNWLRKNTLWKSILANF